MAVSTVRAALWAICGAAVVLFIFFAAIGGIDPGEAEVATLVIGVLALLWLAHAWRRLFGDRDGVSQTDRERRGF